MEWNASCYAKEQFNQKPNLFSTTKEYRDPRNTKRSETEKKTFQIKTQPHTTKLKEFICFVLVAYHRYQRKIL